MSPVLKPGPASRTPGRPGKSTVRSPFHDPEPLVRLKTAEPSNGDGGVKVADRFGFRRVDRVGGWRRGQVLPDDEACAAGRAHFGRPGWHGVLTPALAEPPPVFDRHGALIG